MSRYMTAAAVQALGARLSERDHAVLERVASLRFVSGSQLARLCFWDSADEVANARTARRALLRLVHLGVLDRLPRSIGGQRSGSSGFVYALGLGGQCLAMQRGLIPERRRRRSLVPGTLFLKHTLAVAELHTLLIEGDRSRRFELLELSAEPGCWRALDGVGTQQEMLRPDSYVRIGLAEYEYSYFMEIDRSTQGSLALERQMKRYAVHNASGVEQAERGVYPKVLWLTNSADRVAVIEATVSALPRDQQALFAVAHFDDAVSVLTAAGELAATD